MREPCRQWKRAWGPLVVMKCVGRVVEVFAVGAEADVEGVGTRDG